MSKALYSTRSGVELELEEATASRLFGLEIIKPELKPTKKIKSSKEGTK